VVTRESIAVASDLEKMDARVTYDDPVDQIDRRESSADGALRFGSAAPPLLIAWTKRSRECARRKRMTLTIRHRQGERRDRVEFRAQAGAGNLTGFFRKKPGFKSVGSVHSSEQLNQRVQGSSPCAATNEIKCLSYFTGVTATQKSRQGWPMGGTTIEATA
jgi:hypothetical protein